QVLGGAGTAQQLGDRGHFRVARPGGGDGVGGRDHVGEEHERIFAFPRSSLPRMEYRRLGRSGLQVSVLSFGSWVSFGPQLGVDTAAECLEAAHDAGVNFFDNAESYAGGESERIMGDAISKLGWARHSFVISTKVFWGLHDEPNMKNTLNRKYL